MLKVSANGRYLVHDSGKPFFYLGDTAWELFHRLGREDADLYLENRSRKRFTVIQAVVLAEFKGLYVPNFYGDLPFVDMDINRPNEGYFKHVDYIVGKTNALGMYVGMLPTWGDKVGTASAWGDGPADFINEKNARGYGRFLGTRYAKADIIWILGGDRPGEGSEHIWREMAAGIREGDKGRGLITFHPCGQWHSSMWFHHEPWLDFNMCQTGHTMSRENYRDVALDYAMHPPKPCLDGEPGYEDHPNGWNPGNGYLNDFHCRTFAYWAVFAGACGHTYGCHDIWQFFDIERHPAVSNARTNWKIAIDLPGSFQMTHLHALMLSRPYLDRIPDQSVVTRNQNYFGMDHVQVTRDGTLFKNDATYMMLYFSAPREITLNTSVLAAARLRKWWFNPRTGEATDEGETANEKTMKFASPGKVIEQDWVLVLDDASKGYPAPGDSII
jgi:hypothetical protein